MRACGLTYSPPTTHLLQIVAGVSAFGFGGTNAHVVLESVPKTFDFDQGFDVSPCLSCCCCADCTQTKQSSASKPLNLSPLPCQTQVDANATSGQMTPLPLLLPLSARSEEALKKLAAAYGELLVTKEASKTLSYDRCLEVCLEAGTRRTHHHGVRLAATGRSAPELKAAIAEALEEGALKPVMQVREAAGGGMVDVLCCDMMHAPHETSLPLGSTFFISLPT